MHVHRDTAPPPVQNQIPDYEGDTIDPDDAGDTNDDNRRIISISLIEISVCLGDPTTGIHK